MSKPTIGSLQSLKKLVGYLKFTQDYAVVLEQPVGGSGRWKQSNDKFWILESFSDSDWSGDKRHRRSTSAGMHLLCGAYMFGSSRTQRVISLSSCESELHGMVSTLADGLFLRRCAEFVTRASIEHYLLTDSSSARQLAARQGVGKIKHLSAKILWIQNLVQEKAIILSQISTVWNVAGAGTKVLSSKRLRLLLHQLGVFLKFGDERVGQEEFQETSQRVGGRDMAQMAKVIARVIATMGLGPIGAMGQPTCMADSAPPTDKWWFKVGVMLLVFILIAFAIGCFVVRRYVKTVKRLLHDLYHLSVQVAEADTTVGEHMVAVPQLRNEVNGLRLQLDDVSQRCVMLTTQLAQFEGDMETLNDRQDGLHYGLVEVGGYVRAHELTAAQRRHMYTQERGNLVARTTMGASQYLRTIRTQSRGYTHGEDTDPPVEPESTATNSNAMAATAANNRANTGRIGENAQSSNPTSDMEVDDTMLNPSRDLTTRRGEVEVTIDDLRTQLDQALLDEAWSDAAELQHTRIDCKLRISEIGMSCVIHSIAWLTEWKFCPDVPAKEEMESWRTNTWTMQQAIETQFEAWLRRWKRESELLPIMLCFAWESRQLPRMPSFAKFSKGNGREIQSKTCVSGKAQLAVEII